MSTAKQKPRTLKGFVIAEPRSVGLGRIKAIPFFRYEAQARDLSARWHSEQLTVMRATLTLTPSKPKAGKK